MPTRRETRARIEKARQRARAAQAGHAPSRDASFAVNDGTRRQALRAPKAPTPVRPSGAGRLAHPSIDANEAARRPRGCPHYPSCMRRMRAAANAARATQAGGARQSIG
ncbi:hypothetical protein AQ857_06045 [Burkholderia pseudomallei]|uniref:hypothetical protein n=1 Tax=Burkholderia pseudomallei TaxID=28450 RepID=UPI000572605D|nr:hypothetical protein [Burkholderia pseudomallei]OMZ08997.1 hypothetical protein AQ858_19645 [Burkholderia pseudomallei]OMZ11608.1 hypothetical protein AQ857_06045 [Burkholderia pseudomallei]ONC75384.1 hypothetical protein AQ922_08665 [Burkholderia pseudomallei]